VANHTLPSNRFAGHCKFCDVHVPADAGVYDYSISATVCSDTIWLSLAYLGGDMLYANYNQLIERFAQYDKEFGATCLHRYNQVCGTDFANRDAVRAAQRAEVEATREANIAKAAAQQQEQRRAAARERRKRNKMFRDSNTCPRCEGEGVSPLRWKHDGGKCYRCHGTGKYNNNQTTDTGDNNE